ncbi:XcbB/CpsF family capsular polysaccharide biosynthesis protein [Agrilactobacillus yilanensis]|uniref:XcbB/CpsF family capsular polysaccharide biosynthesis protein n=1 Tax=Agrilactobacillus yilanensis TaxID=2485997 RepID=A0ABW4J552_9LACO|nr:XcbB/CpsF family capsular polysaccharide biosynthesis protein [Agrilactobacillus yilanensis]
MKIKQYDATATNLDWTADKLIINTTIPQSLLALTTRFDAMRILYQELMNHDYIYYMFQGNKSYFIKRPLVGTLWQRQDLQQHGATFYTLQTIKAVAKNHLAPLRLLVLFSATPDEAQRLTSNIADRMLINNAALLAPQLLDNTMILSVMDLCRSSGSFYFDTPQYPDFEQDIGAMIIEVMQKYHIAKDDVVLYGQGRGGTAALYYGLCADYNAVSVNPVLTLTSFTAKNDTFFLNDSLPTNFLTKFEPFLTAPLTYPKILIATPMLNPDAKFYAELHHEKLQVMSLYNSLDTTLQSAMTHTVAAQVTWLNYLWLQSKHYLKVNQHIAKLSQAL